MGDAVMVLLAGLCTVDLLQRVDELPAPGAKVAARAAELAAGGPAANAAIAAAVLGARSVLLTALGAHPLAEVARRDLTGHGVSIVDTMPGAVAPPTVSAVSVRESDGERTVVSRNAAHVSVAVPAELPDLVSAAQAVLVDGHHPELALAAARIARRCGMPVLLDAGSYKPVHRGLLPLVDVWACAEGYRWPHRASVTETEHALLAAGVGIVTWTRGAAPVRWVQHTDQGEVSPPRVVPVDTLGAGDVWHGALAVELARLGRAPTSAELPAMISAANRVAATRVQYAGARGWISEWRRHAPK